MTKSDAVDLVSENLSERAKVIIEEGHSQIDIMKSAFNDFKSIGSLSGLMAIANSGTLNEGQVEIAKRLAVKVLAVIAISESKKGA